MTVAMHHLHVSELRQDIPIRSTLEPEEEQTWWSNNARQSSSIGWTLEPGEHRPSQPHHHERDPRKLPQISILNFYCIRSPGVS